MNHAIIYRSAVDVEDAAEPLDIAEWIAALAAEADGQQGPFPLESFRGLPASHATYNERSLHHNICRGLAAREPKSRISGNLYKKIKIRKICKLTLPTKLSAEPTTSKFPGRPPCGLEGVDWMARWLIPFLSITAVIKVQGKWDLDKFQYNGTKTLNLWLLGFKS